MSLAALAVMGAFALASGFAPNEYWLAALRFGVGAGAAFFFAPALGLVAAYYPPGSRGPIIGLYNSGFSVGAAGGLFAGALIGVAFGWTWTLAVGGIGLLLIGAFAAAVLPRTSPDPIARTWRELFAAAAPVLSSRPLWALALAGTGFWGALYIVAQYFVDFAAHVHPVWSIALAASLPTVLILVEIVGGPIGGWIAERRRDMRIVLLAFAIPAVALVMAIPFLGLSELFGVFAFLGFADGVVFTVLYLLPTLRPEASGEGFALALGLLNGVQIIAGSALTIAFGFIAVDVSYTAAWVFTGLVGLATLPLLVWVRGSKEGVPALAPERSTTTVPDPP